MTQDAGPIPGILGSLRAAGAAGVVRIEERYDTTIDDLWEAVTDPSRLARWYGQVEGDLRPGGEIRTYIPGPDLEATGKVTSCEPPRKLTVTSRETDESYERGHGVPPHDGVIDVSLTPDADGTLLVVEISGMPLDKIAAYGAGWQIHAEQLAAHLAGRQPVDVGARWESLAPSYEQLAAAIPQQGQ